MKTHPKVTSEQNGLDMKTAVALLILSVSVGVSIQSVSAQSASPEPQKPAGESEGVYQPPELRGIKHSETPNSNHAVDANPKRDIGELGELGDLKADPASTQMPLSGAAKVGASISIEAGSVPPNHGLFGMRIRVVNDTKEPLVFDGDNVSIAGAEGRQVSSPMPEMDTTGFPPCTGKGQFKKVVVSGITIGAVPTLKDMKIAKGPKLERYGCDELRREDEVARFGKRVVWPGASSNGIVYFKTTPSKGATMEMPVSALFDSNDKTVVTTAIR